MSGLSSIQNMLGDDSGQDVRRLEQMLREHSVQAIHKQTDALVFEFENGQQAAVTSPERQRGLQVVFG
jgi:hypothetical protein